MQDEPSQTKRYSIAYSLDRGDFFRRCCPNCGLCFKTKADAESLVSPIQSAFRRIGQAIGADMGKRGEDVTAEDTLHCPYCRATASPSEMLAPEFEEYLKRYALREILRPQINRMLSELADRHPSSRPSSGLVSISIRMNFMKGIDPTRPICGPEQPDMVPVRLLCCDSEAKLIGAWQSLVCPYCGEEVVLH